MTPEEFNNFLSAISEINTRLAEPQDLVFFFKIMYWCGLRIREALKIKAEDIDLEKRIIYLGTTKTRKNDIATIPVIFLKELALWLYDKPDGLLWPDLNYHIVYHWLKQIGNQKGIKAFTTPQSETGEKTMTHIFRKSIAKALLYGEYGQKQPVSLIMQKLRHENIETTTKYLRMQSLDVINAGW